MVLRCGWRWCIVSGGVRVTPHESSVGGRYSRKSKQEGTSFSNLPFAIILGGIYSENTHGVCSSLIKYHSVNLPPLNGHLSLSVIGLRDCSTGQFSSYDCLYFLTLCPVLGGDDYNSRETNTKPSQPACPSTTLESVCNQNLTPRVDLFLAVLTNWCE